MMVSALKPNFFCNAFKRRGRSEGFHVDHPTRGPGFQRAVPASIRRWLGLDVAIGRHFLLSTASLNVLVYEHSRSDP
jgi:hypothetical protein